MPPGRRQLSYKTVRMYENNEGGMVPDVPAMYRDDFGEGFVESSSPPPSIAQRMQDRYAREPHLSEVVRFRNALFDSMPTAPTPKLVTVINEHGFFAPSPNWSFLDCVMYSPFTPKPMYRVPIHACFDGLCGPARLLCSCRNRGEGVHVQCTDCCTCAPGCPQKVSTFLRLMMYYI